MSLKPKTKALTMLLGAGCLFLLAFFLLPLLFVLYESFLGTDGNLTVSRYLAVLQDNQFQNVYLRTLKMAVIVTVIAVFTAYPTAYLMMKIKSSHKAILMSLVILPLMTSPVARTYAWIVILGRYGIVNQTLSLFGLTREPVRMLYTEGAIVVGLLQLFLPIMVLNLVSALENVPSEVEEAALSLGSSKIGTFFRVIVPLSFDGLIMGVTLVFTGCITAYVTPAILGGAKVLTLATLMRQQALVLMNWEAATVIAVVMILTTLILHTVLKRFRPRNQT
ncbi:MAG: ABC transporter permease [Sphaerochaetaceae bacterium]|jgi:putative spermidine/putrescine transport system permease protein|nr:ABC transporter permease [Sphaerochaetaceae bacterium]MDD3942333.1 ABC transporter permease [Sphaerochaetaceae bacterium]MDX9940032.1 ABC transporter permease [Sphaerochaetaceae bacterium]